MKILQNAFYCVDSSSDALPYHFSRFIGHFWHSSNVSNTDKINNPHTQATPFCLSGIMNGIFLPFSFVFFIFLLYPHSLSISQISSTGDFTRRDSVWQKGSRNDNRAREPVKLTFNQQPTAAPYDSRLSDCRPRAKVAVAATNLNAI